MHYTGIGSRETPISLRDDIHKVSLYLQSQGYTLRSGGAPGADTFFEEQITNKEIYLPWYKFNGNNSPLYTITPEAIALTSQYHPAWNKLSGAAKKLMARNCYQVLGSDLQTPSKFVLCWTKDGNATGGTGQAMRIAKAYSIPIINLFHTNWKQEVWKLIN